MNKFIEGQRVLVKKPNNLNEYPGWNRQMNKFDNTIQVILYKKEEHVYLKNIAWVFSYNWLTPLKCLNE
jgi:hypothetical protein